jgi:ABC-type uncharacterized transport system ATPase subunit
MLEIKNVTKKFGSFTAVNNLNLQLNLVILDSLDKMEQVKQQP